MEKIQIKTYFSDWKEVSREVARNWAKTMLSHGGIRKNIIKSLRNRIKGITLEELLGEEF